MDILFAYLAGLLTLINPCVLPVLPIVLASSLNAHRAGPLVLAAGMGLSFTLLGVGLTAFGHLIGLTVEGMAQVGALAMIVFGAVLMVPALSARFATATAGFAARADTQMGTGGAGLSGQFLGGLLLGVVWVPCIGPTLGGAIALASTGQSLFWVTLVMIGFSAGVGTLIIGMGYGAQRGLRGRLRVWAHRTRPAMGLLFLLTGIALYFHLFQPVEIWLIENLPLWLQDLSVRF